MRPKCDLKIYIITMMRGALMDLTNKDNANELVM